MIGDSRERVLLVLDMESVDAEPEQATLLDKALVETARKITGSLREKLFIKRAYGSDERLSLLHRLQRAAGWRLGGTGHDVDVVPYILSDCKAFCLERPEETILVLCSNRPEFRELVGELDGAGVDVNVVRPAME